MKRGTPDHPKTRRLMRLLRIRRYVAIGLLESLWHFTMRYAPTGDLGHWEWTEIATFIDWRGDPQRLRQALIDARWLEPGANGQLIVHHWHEHADQTTKRYIEAHKLAFASIKFAEDSPPASLPAPAPAPAPASVPSASASARTSVSRNATVESSHQERTQEIGSPAQLADIGARLRIAAPSTKQGQVDASQIEKAVAALRMGKTGDPDRAWGAMLETVAELEQGRWDKPITEFTLWCQKQGLLPKRRRK